MFYRFRVFQNVVSDLLSYYETGSFGAKLLRMPQNQISVMTGRIIGLRLVFLYRKALRSFLIAALIVV